MNNGTLKGIIGLHGQILTWCSLTYYGEFQTECYKELTWKMTEKQIKLFKNTKTVNFLQFSCTIWCNFDIMQHYSPYIWTDIWGSLWRCSLKCLFKYMVNSVALHQNHIKNRKKKIDDFQIFLKLCMLFRKKYANFGEILSYIVSPPCFSSLLQLRFVLCHSYKCLFFPKYFWIFKQKGKFELYSLKNN